MGKTVNAILKDNIIINYSFRIFMLSKFGINNFPTKVKYCTLCTYLIILKTYFNKYFK